MRAAQNIRSNVARGVHTSHCITAAPSCKIAPCPLPLSPPLPPPSARAGGWIPFDRYLEIALHDPQAGFYGSGRVRFGADGDFITAPGVSPLFAEMLAKQAAQILQNLPNSGGDFLELGAGDGRLSASVAKLLRGKIRRHYILETSAALRMRQEETLRGENISWLDALPQSFCGVVVANEVLDAVPFCLYAKRGGEWRARGVACENGALQWCERPAAKDAIVCRLEEMNLPDGYISEANPRAEALTKTLCEMLRAGALLLSDYGFGRREYYHPLRASGTMMCHRMQRADDSPLDSPGDKDITAHVDFTAVADAGIEGGAAFGGYATQAQFLLNCGAAETLEKKSQTLGAMEYAKLAAGAQKLLAPHEMGELFKFIAFVKGETPPLLGFAKDARRRL